MPSADTTWYCNSVGYAAVTARPQNAAVAVGALRRQFTAPAVNSERVFVCIVAGTTANVTDATWVITKGAKTTDGTVTWQECTGTSAMNGDLTNTPNWTQQKALSTPTLGNIIKRNNGVSYQICTTQGTLAASEPAFSDTAGVTTNDGTSVWTSLGPVGNFTAGGAAPHARLANAVTSSWIGSNGATVYVGNNHAETQASAIGITVPTTVALLVKILCHNVSGSYPPTAANLTTGATVTTTGASTITISGNGATYIYGVAFLAGTGAVTASITLGASVAGQFLDNCSLQLVNTGAASRIFFGGGGAPSLVIVNNTPVKFGAVGQGFDYGGAGQFIWQNTAPGIMAGSVIPSALFFWNALFSATKVTVEAVDLSAATGLINFANPVVIDLLFKDCKLNASATVTPASRICTNIQFIRCDSGATAYKSTRYNGEGTETTETAITRVGGAVDPTGQAQSRKIVTTTTPSWVFPFKAEPYGIWNDRTAANVTVTVRGTVNDAALPRNDDIWLEVEYLGSSASPQGTIFTTTKASILAANAAVASDGSSWNGGGSGAGWSPFKLEATLSSPQPGLAGYIHARVRAAKPSVTYYIDPQVALS